MKILHSRPTDDYIRWSDLIKIESCVAVHTSIYFHAVLRLLCAQEWYGYEAADLDLDRVGLARVDDARGSTTAFVYAVGGAHDPDSAVYWRPDGPWIPVFPKRGKKDIPVSLSVQEYVHARHADPVRGLRRLTQHLVQSMRDRYGDALVDSIEWTEFVRLTAFFLPIEVPSASCPACRPFAPLPTHPFLSFMLRTGQVDARPSALGLPSLDSVVHELGKIGSRLTEVTRRVYPASMGRPGLEFRFQRRVWRLWSDRAALVADEEDTLRRAVHADISSAYAFLSPTHADVHLLLQVFSLLRLYLEAYVTHADRCVPRSTPRCFASLLLGAAALRDEVVPPGETMIWVEKGLRDNADDAVSAEAIEATTRTELARMHPVYRGPFLASKKLKRG